LREEPRVDVRYALTEKDVLDDELGRIPDLPLSKALEVAERYMRGAYYMVKLIKRR